MTASDPTTVVMTLKRPQSNFLISQNLPQFGIQSPTALKAGDADNPDPAKSPYAQGQGGTGKSMVGTGPFMYKEWVPNDHVTIVKNPAYWDTANAAHLDEISFKPFADQTAELNALQAGDIDFAQTIAPNDVATLHGGPELRGSSTAASRATSSTSACRTARLPFDNPKIRQAIAYALNKQSYIDAFYAGLANVADNFMPPATQDYKALGLPTYDPEKAKALIAESGVSADKLAIDFYYPSDVARPYMPDPKGEAEAIATDLEAVGFKINFKTEGWRTGYLTRLRRRQVPHVPARLDVRLGRPGQLPDHRPVLLQQRRDAEPAVRLRARRAQDRVRRRPRGDERSRRRRPRWSTAQDILATDLPIVPILNSTPPGAYARRSRLRGQRQPDGVLQHRLAQPVVSRT